MITKEMSEAREASSAGEIAVLKETLYPDCSDRSIGLVLAYCKANGLDPMSKPWHITKRKSKIKDANGRDEWVTKEVLMPGIDLYRIRAHRSGNYAGLSSPRFGDAIEETLNFGSGNFTDKIEVFYPEWCELTVSKIVNGQVCQFTSRRYWKEFVQFNNKIWATQPYAQLEKCTEMAVLKKAWGEIEVPTMPTPIIAREERPFIAESRTLESFERIPGGHAAMTDLTLSVNNDGDVISEDTLGLINFYISSYAIPKETVDKWYEKFQVKSLFELSEENGKKILHSLEKRFNNEKSES